MILELASPMDLTFGDDGHLYVSNYTEHNILKYDGSTGVFIDTFASGGGLENPFGLDFGPDVNLYVVSEATNGVNRYDGVTCSFIDNFVASGSGGLRGPNYLHFTEIIPAPGAVLLASIGLSLAG